MKQRVVHFYSAGCKLEGDYFLPDDIKPGEKRPGIVLCHGYSGIRPLILPDYAQVFVEAGYPCLTFDYRGYGGSEGTKYRIMAMEQIEDIRNAITYLETLPEVNADRIGIWGTSNGGAHIVTTAGLDQRVKCAVGQVGYGDGWRLLMDIRSPAEREALLKLLAADRKQRVLTGKGGHADTATLLASPQTKAAFAAGIPEVPALYCEIPWESAESTMEYRPIDYAARIAPRALMLIGAEKDDLCKIDGYKAVFDAAKEPKKWVQYPIGHYEIYQPEWVAPSAKAATEWFDQHLKK
jgi:uncharacterized protein